MSDAPQTDPAYEFRHTWIIGAGLAGALLARLLSRSEVRHHATIHVSERRSSVELEQLAPGRSINLALAERGRVALRAGGSVLVDEQWQSLDAEVMNQAIAMPGRAVHLADGSLNFLPYSSDGEAAIWSVHRARMNRTLLHAALQAGCQLHFNERLLALDLDQRSAVIEHVLDGVRVEKQIRFQQIFGCDGAGSIVREKIAELTQSPTRVEFLDHGYKELHIAPLADAQSQTSSEHAPFRLNPSALHIWPRRSEQSQASSAFMLIALPNPDFSFTATLFLPNHGPDSFDSLKDPQQRLQFIERYFPDLPTLVENLDQQLQEHPVGLLGTLHCSAWHYQDKAVILGDAAHAIVPFHGQGMNCALEDCVSLSESLQRHPNDLQRAFAEFAEQRQPQAQAIAKMALENYLEMRDGVADPEFLLRKSLEHALAKRMPGHFVPRYELVSFTARPYLEALQRGVWQSELLHRYCTGKTTLTDIDLDAACAEIERGLAKLAP